MPIVPVVRFWSTDESIGLDELVRALKGQSSRYRRVMVPAADRAAIAAALGIRIADSVRGGNPAAIERAVKHGALGLIRGADLPFSVRALAIDGRSLFGNGRIDTLARWPLTIQVSVPPDQVWDQVKTWTLVAGGDSMTDRGIYERVVNRHRGLDYPFAGGRVRVTGHYCCGPRVQGWPAYEVPSYRSLGDRGVVRALVRDADVAIANHESPTPRNWVFHLHSTVFSGDPALTEIFTRAGIDWFSLANNHVRDFGTDGIMDTRRTMDRWGIAYTGAGENVDQAGRISYRRVKGVRVALIACSAITGNWASRTSGGALPCKDRYVLPRIREADRKADVVIVFPHWGVEYKSNPLRSQRRYANRWQKAGADLVIGAHSHVAGAIEQKGRTPVFYSLGNFIFDQNFRTSTMESVLLEATFHGDRLVQLRLHPFLTHDQAQPNLLDPRTDDGRAVLRTIRRASNDWLDW
jgi:poly-gamma-glutamate synthesis protein (capsule biosynthesis protein)